MSREKDSAIVYELVTSKYKIAQRNRLAKFRFLTEMNSGSMKRHGSEPSVAQIEKTEVAKVDLSVPGTPVSSRLIASLKKRSYIDTDSENEDIDKIDVATDKTPKYQSILNEELKKFTNDMEKLQNNVSHDPLQKYFEDSDKKKSYRRDFSEVVSEFSIKKQEPETIAKVEKYFQESERMKSFKRDFTEVVQTFDPRNPSGREQFIDLKKIGTPISSRLIAVEKLSSALENESVSDIKVMNGNVENHKNSQVEMNFNGITDDVKPKKDDSLKTIDNKDSSHTIGVSDVIIEEENLVIDEEGKESLEAIPSGRVYEEKLQIHEEPNGVNIHQEVPKIDEKKMLEVSTSSENAKENAKIPDKPKRIKKTDSSSSLISIPGTPVSSRDLASLRNSYIEIDDSGSEDEDEGGTGTKESLEIKTLAKEFMNEIENLVQKSFDDDRQEVVLEQLEKTTSENVEQSKPMGESDEKLIIHEEQPGDSNPIGSGNKVEDYFEKSKLEKTYKRTFSEVENFNKVSQDVKEKVENYFKESEQKRSLTRPFSQAINYVEPKIDVEQLLKPGTPVSSKLVTSLKKQYLSKQSSINGDDEEDDPEALQGREAFRKAQDALRDLEKGKEKFVVDDYFKESEDRKTYRRDFSEVLYEVKEAPPGNNPEIEKYFEQSDAQKSFQRPFSEVFQSVPPRIEDILKLDEKVVEHKNEKPFHYQRSSRASSVSSNCSDQSESGSPKKSKKHGKKYGIDKYFAASLYRTAYHRSNSRRESKDSQHGSSNDLKIVEDEDVFGETDYLRKQEFQHDDETRVTQESNDINENQTVHFWRDFLKPYNLNLQTEITITRDELLNNRTLE